MGCYENELSERNGNTTYYVSSDNGNDENIGSAENSFETIAKGMKSAWYGDTVIVYPGSYLEDIYYRGKNLILGSLYLDTGDTSFINSTIIEGNVSVLNGEDESAKITGFTLSNHNGIASGSGIYIDNSSGISIDKMKIKWYNTSGVTMKNSSATITGSEIFNNTRGGTGGGIHIYNNSSAYIETSQIFDNSAINNQSGGGIGLENNSVVEIRQSKIFNNNTNEDYGGGIFARNGSNLNIHHTEVFNNFAGDGGGGISIEYDGDLFIDSSKVANNSAGSSTGGGIYFRQGSSNNHIIKSTEISNNEARVGGGLWIESANSIQINNSQIINNTVTDNSGGISIGDNINSFIIEGTLIAENYANDRGGA